MKDDEVETDLTVILPTKQVDRNLLRAVDTTLSALGERGKLLLFLDGCVDQTEYLENIYAHEPRMAFFGSSKRVGLAKALNRLLNHVQTTYVARMDGDDLTLRWRFSYQIRLLKKYDVDIIFSPCILKVEKGRLSAWWLQSLRSIPSREVGINLLVDNPLAHPTMVAKTSALKALGGYRPVATEDYDLWIRAAGRGLKMMRTRLPTLIYRIHSGQTTASMSWRNQAARETFKAEKVALANVIFGPSMKLCEALETAHVGVWNSGILRRLEYVGFRRSLRLLMKRGVFGLFGPAPSLESLNNV